MSDKGDFMQGDKGSNPARRYNSKYICSKHQSLHIHKTNTSELKGTDRTRYNNCGRSQLSTVFSRQNIQRENQQRYPRSKQYL
jgi:hypothetical protein